MAIEQKVCIIGGFTEGKHHARPFVHALKKNGFDITRNTQDANIVVAHSGGCFLLPADLVGKLVIIANPPCEYDGSILTNTKHKAKLDYQAHRATGRMRQHLQKTAWSGLYFFTRSKRHLRMLKQSPNFAVTLPKTNARKTIVITGKSDPWSKNISQKTIAANPTYDFLNLVATHDDIWMHPEHYVAIIQSVYEP